MEPIHPIQIWKFDFVSFESIIKAKAVYYLLFCLLFVVIRYSLLSLSIRSVICFNTAVGHLSIRMNPSVE